MGMAIVTGYILLRKQWGHSFVIVGDGGLLVISGVSHMNALLKSWRWDNDRFRLVTI